MTRRDPTGPAASRLRQRKYEILRRYRIPEEALAGSFVLTHSRCGRPNCHCASAEKGHPGWSLTFMVDAKKCVQRIPAALVDEVRPLVEEGRAFTDAVAEVFSINAQLLALWRKQQTKKKMMRKK